MISLLIFASILTIGKASQAIIDRLSRTEHVASNTLNPSDHPLYILSNPEVTSLNGLSFDNDDIMNLFLDMHFKSINGVKRWPKDLDTLYISNMHDFNILSLSQIPESVTSLSLLYTNFSDHPKHEDIKLPVNLKRLNMQLCEATHESIAALNFQLLSNLVELHLVFKSKSPYSDRYPIVFPPTRLEHLEIDFNLMQNIVTHQDPQAMHLYAARLRYVMLANTHLADPDDVRKIRGRINKHFERPEDMPLMMHLN